MIPSKASMSGRGQDHPIDFVLAWMDPNDENWRREKAKYWALETHNPSYDANAVARFRDWDNLRYWFRGVEKFAPWVRQIHFCTWDSVPAWLNLAHPMLRVVRDRELIPPECAPAFSPNPMEINLHRIPGLSDHFVYFNDDMFLLSAVLKDDFFVGGLPREMAVPYLLVNPPYSEPFAHMLFAISGVINGRFSLRAAMRKHPGKWFSPRYGRHLLTTLKMLPQRDVSALLIPHLPSSMCKSTYEEVWAAIPDRLAETTAHRFRNPMDLTQYIFRYWAIMKGDFHPTNVYRYGREFFATDSSLDELCGVIQGQQCKLLLINDSKDIRDFARCRDRVNASFEKILPVRSGFELY